MKIWRSQTHSLSTIHTSFYLLDIPELIVYLAILSRKSQWKIITEGPDSRIHLLSPVCSQVDLGNHIYCEQHNYSEPSAGCCWMSLHSVSFLDHRQTKLKDQHPGMAVPSFSCTVLVRKEVEKTPESREHSQLAVACIYLDLKWN